MKQNIFKRASRHASEIEILLLRRDGLGMNKRGQYSFLYRYNILSLLWFVKYD